jgi:hypothetical protein
MPGHTLTRILVERPRTAEYFDRRELATMTGQPAARFPDVVLKELCDNALDAAEAAGVAPRLDIGVRVNRRRLQLTVKDNGSGISPDVVRRILNFSTRVSDKSVYRSPTRGALGNATKTIIGIPYALGAKGPLRVEARGVKHVIEPAMNPAGELQVGHRTEDVPAGTGTLVSLMLPAAACREFRPARWARAFALFNPHAVVRIQKSEAGGELANGQAGSSAKKRNAYHPTVPFPDGWRKFLPTDLTSAWWYDEAALTRLIYAHIGEAGRGGKDLTLREFVRQFRGNSQTGRAKAVCAQFPEVKHLSDFEQHPGAVAPLLAALRADIKVPAPGVLGLIGKDHFQSCFDRWYGVKRFWYHKSTGTADGIPYVFEAALATTERPGDLFQAINFSPTFDDPFAGAALASPKFVRYGCEGFLLEADAYSPYKPCRTAVAVHLSCPVLEFTDKGKTKLQTTPWMRGAAADSLWKVAKVLWAESERRKKDAAAQERAERAADREAAQEERAREWSRKKAVFHVLPQAVKQATGDGQLPVSAHTLFYHIRPLIQPYTSKELKKNYCEQKLLPAYQQKHGPIPGLYYEPRGTLYEPHGGKVVPLGTRQVSAYEFPIWSYDKILFIEKQGLWPTFQAARLAERYDMAIVAGEGFATEACRVLFKNADKGRDYQLFVLHDADPWGYNIARTLREETARMPGYHVDVIDLGLKLEDALALGLGTEEFTRKKGLPQALDLTPLERKYFVGRPAGKHHIARRVELNAFSGPGLLAYAERKLAEAGVRGKVIPTPEAFPGLLKTHARIAVSTFVKETINQDLDVDGIARRIAEKFEGLAPADQARAKVVSDLEADRLLSWRVALGAQLSGLLQEKAVEIKTEVQAEIKQALEKKRE